MAEVAVLAGLEHAGIAHDLRRAADAQLGDGHGRLAAHAVVHVAAHLAVVDVARIRDRQHGHVGRDELVAVELLGVAVDQRLVVRLPRDVRRAQRIGLDQTEELHFVALARRLQCAIDLRTRRVYIFIRTLFVKNINICIYSN